MKTIIEKKYLVRTLSVLCLALTLAFLTSCDDDEDKSNGNVELLSFGPAGVQHGEEIVFIGRNLDKVTSIVFYPSVEIPRSAFTSATNERIRVVIPETVESGRVVLKTPAGDIESKTIFDLEVPVVITSVSLEAKPGTNITITGEMINWIYSVVFANNVVVEREAFVSQSMTELVVTVPMEARTGLVTFITGGTEPLTINSEEVLTVTLPTPSDISPASIRHTENITITGADLDLVVEVKFPGGGSVSRDNFVSQSETELVVTVPATTTDGKLTVVAGSGIEIETEDEISIILPDVTAFSPADADDHDPGVTLTMTGTELDQVKSLTFPNVDTPVEEFVSHTPNEIQVVIPEDAEGGTVVITTIHGFQVPITVPFGNQLTLAKIIFDDAANAPFGAGSGWGGTTSVVGTEKVRAGTSSIKVTFVGGWGGAAQFGNWSGQSLATTGATYYAFSIYGEPGTGDKVLNVIVGGVSVLHTIVEGEWQDIQIPLSSFNNPASISEVSFQDRDWSGVVYIDHIGLK